MSDTTKDELLESYLQTNTSLSQVCLRIDKLLLDAENKQSEHIEALKDLAEQLKLAFVTDSELIMADMKRLFAIQNHSLSNANKVALNHCASLYNHIFSLENAWFKEQAKKLNTKE